MDSAQSCEENLDHQLVIKTECEENASTTSFLELKPENCVDAEDIKNNDLLALVGYNAQAPIKSEELPDEKPFVCGTCSNCFTNLCDLTNHKCVTKSKTSKASGVVISHPVKSSTKCTTSEISSANRKNPKTNVYKPIKCKICYKRFTSSTKLKYHLVIHGEKSFVCCFCDKGYFWKRSLQYHVLTHLGVRNFECDFCMGRFYSKCNLQKHLRVHLGLSFIVPKPSVCFVKCNICQKQFASKNSLNYHHHRVHSSEKYFNCDSCKLFFSKRSQLNYHMVSHPHKVKKSEKKGLSPQVCLTPLNPKKEKLLNSHDKEKLLKTPNKEKILKGRNRLNLEKWFKNVNQERRQCKICQEWFTGCKALYKHGRVHKHRYECKICEKNFFDSSHLKNHLRTHTGERPFECQFCSKKFSEQNNLSRHIRIHTGDKPYKCGVCFKSFVERSKLNRHFLVHNC